MKNRGVNFLNFFLIKDFQKMKKFYLCTPFLRRKCSNAVSGMFLKKHGARSSVG